MELKEVMEQIATSLGMEFSYDDSQGVCSNVYRFFESLLKFLGGSND